WGQLKPSRPQKAMAIPDMFLTPAYESQLGAFWVEALSNGKLSDLKIVLSAPEKDKSVGAKPFDNAPQFINIPMRKGKRLAEELKSIHIEGSFGVTDSNFYPKHVKFFNLFKNLTTLRLTNINLGVQVFQYDRRLRTDIGQIICPNLVELHLVGCRLPFRSIESRGGSIIGYDAQSLLCYLTNTNSLIENKMRVQKLTVAHPQIHSMNIGRKHIWSFSNNSSFLFIHLQYLDLSRHRIAWNSLETCFHAFGIKLRCLILDNCIIDDYDEQAANISLFIDKHLPEKLQGSVADPGKARNRGATLESSTPEDDGWFVNCHNLLPDKIYFLTVYWAESKRETLKGAFTLVGY
ncbi:hypothetical protein HDU97_009053, partial [Phlyctochytrium planicorne]